MKQITNKITNKITNPKPIQTCYWFSSHLYDISGNITLLSSYPNSNTLFNSSGHFLKAGRYLITFQYNLVNVDTFRSCFAHIKFYSGGAGLLYNSGSVGEAWDSNRGSMYQYCNEVSLTVVVPTPNTHYFAITTSFDINGASSNTGYTGVIQITEL